MARVIAALAGLMLFVLAAGCGDATYPFTVVNDAVEVEYTLHSAGTVTVTVANSAMLTVRTLLTSTPQDAGVHTVVWDLLDDGGLYPGDGLYTVEVYLDGTRVSVRILEVDRQ
jgi:flagellar hook assembly protein FlgD